MRYTLFDWRLLLFGISTTFVLCLLDALLESDGLLYFFGVIPLISLVLIVALVVAAISKKTRYSLSGLLWVFSFNSAAQFDQLDRKVVMKRIHLEVAVK